MNFLEIVRFEIDYRLRRPYTWILFAVFVAVAWLMAVGLLVGEAERAGDVNANAPSLVGMATILVSMIGLVISAALFSEAALRDHDARMFPLFATSPLTKTEYLAGRFAGTLLVNVLFVSIVPIMLMLLMRPPFVKGELLGPFRAASYVQPAIVLLLPNVLFTGALLFAVGVLTRRALAVFATAGGTTATPGEAAGGRSSSRDGRNCASSRSCAPARRHSPGCKTGQCSARR